MTTGPNSIAAAVVEAIRDTGVATVTALGLMTPDSFPHQRLVIGAVGLLSLFLTRLCKYLQLPDAPPAGTTKTAAPPLGSFVPIPTAAPPPEVAVTKS